MMDILHQEAGSGIKGLIHGFSGDSAALKDWLALGFYISIGFRGFVINEIASLQTVVGEIPLDRLLTETDSTATGQPAGPADVLLVVEKMASLRGDTAEDIANAATANLKRLLKL
jgi:TatD DNase family protein